MSDRMANLIICFGGGAGVAAALAGLALTFLEGERVFAARLVAGLAGCL